MKDYVTQLYRGWPETSGDTLEEMVEKGHLVPVLPKENGRYNLPAGVYSCHITGEGIYPTLKVFCIKENNTEFCLQNLAAKSLVPLQMHGGSPQGYQPTVVVPDAPEFFKRTQKDELLCIWPDEILGIYADRTVPEHHQCMLQSELESRMQSMADQCDRLQCYVMGRSLHYGLSIPLAILSKEEISVDSWETALEALAKGEKVNILYQAQIHGNEPAACDGALAVIEAFCQDESFQQLLDYVNLVVVPRVNPEAAYLYRRMAYDNIDLNRDHMAGEAYETRLMHRTFQMLKPEVVLDGHEFTFFVTETEDGKGYVAKGCEIMTSPATSLHIDQAVRDCSYKICGQVFDDLREKAYRVFHFGTAEKSSLGRGFYGLHQCLSFLIETRGIGGGRYGYEKRIHAQKNTMLAYIKRIADAGRLVKEIVAEAREKSADITEVVLHHGSSASALTPYKGMHEQYYLDGTLRSRTKDALILNDLTLRKREAPTGYLMAADEAHIQDIVQKVKNLGCQVEKLERGTTAKVRRYCCKGLREAEADEKDIVADLLAVEEVCFDTGAYAFTSDDFRVIPLAMLMEPDVTDTVGTKGSLFQQGLLGYDRETGLFPLYRINEM